TLPLGLTELAGYVIPACVVVGEKAADDGLAAAVAVDVGGVEEGDARLRGRLENRPGVRPRDVTPVCAELPRAESHDGDGASGPAQGALVHEHYLPPRAGVSPRRLC